MDNREKAIKVVSTIPAVRTGDVVTSYVFDCLDAELVVDTLIKEGLLKE